jgi:hypothetical protein
VVEHPRGVVGQRQSYPSNEQRQAGIFMSDDFTPPTPSEPPVPEPTVQAAVPTHELTATVETGSGGGKRVALIVGIVAILGAGIFAAFSLLSNDGNTPAAGATDFMESFAAEDLLGATENLLPAERRFLAEPLLGWIDELERLGILGDVDTSDVQGFDFGLENMTYETEEIGEGLAWVSITGDVTSSVIAEDIPLGSLFEQFMPAEALAEIPDEVSDSDNFEDDFGLALVEEDGTWYVSVMHTIAEVARREAGKEFPETSTISEPQGAATPEEALEQLFVSLVALDARSVIDVVDPDESLAFRRYSGLFFADWETALADARSQLTAAGVSIGIDEITVETSGSGDDLIAFITDVPGFHLTAELPGLPPMGIERVDGCLTVNLDPALLGAFGGEVDPGIDISQFDGETCIDLAGQVAGDQAEMMDAVLDLVSTLPVLGTLMDTYADYGDTPTGYAITESDGGYFVSPFLSANAQMRAVTAPLTEQTLATLIEEVQAIQDDPEAALANFMDALASVDPNGPLGPLLDQAAGLAAPGAAVPVDPPAEEEPPAEVEPEPEESVDSEADTGFEVSAEELAFYADVPTLLLLFDFDVAESAAELRAIYGENVVAGEIGNADTYQLILDAYGEDGVYGLGPDEFLSSLILIPLDIDTLVEIFNRPEFLDIYTLAELGL